MIKKVVLVNNETYMPEDDGNIVSIDWDRESTGVIVKFSNNENVWIPEHNIAKVVYLNNLRGK